MTVELFFPVLFIWLCRYTLWNAEYRLTLQRNLDLSAEDLNDATSQTREQLICENKEIEVINNNRFDGINDPLDEFHMVGKLDQLSQEAFDYITQLKSRLYDMQKVGHNSSPFWNWRNIYLYWIYLQDWILDEFMNHPLHFWNEDS